MLKNEKGATLVELVLGVVVVLLVVGFSIFLLLDEGRGDNNLGNTDNEINTVQEGNVNNEVEDIDNTDTNDISAGDTDEVNE